MTPLSKTFRFRGEEFDVERPHRCWIRVNGPKGYTGEMSVHEVTGAFRESIHGQGTDQPPLEAALHAVCTRLLKRASSPTVTVRSCRYGADTERETASGDPAHDADARPRRAGEPGKAGEQGMLWRVEV